MSVYRDKKYYIDLQTAFQQDCESLITKYVLHTTTQFDEFAKLWKDEQFVLIYVGKYKEYEVAHFTQLILHCTKKYLLFPTDLYTKVAALYIIYALYFKQPIKNLVKVRFLKEEFQNVLEFITVLQNKRLIEPLYVLKRLLEAGAFDFAASQFPLFLETRYTQADVVLSNNIFTIDCHKLLKEFDDETVAALTKIKEHDNTYARKLAEYKNKKPDILLTSIDSSNLVQELEAAVAEIETSEFANRSTEVQKFSEAFDQTAENGCGGSVRRNLINKAYNAQNQSKYIQDRQGASTSKD